MRADREFTIRDHTRRPTNAHRPWLDGTQVAGAGRVLRLLAASMLCVVVGCGARSGSDAESGPGSGGEAAVHYGPATGCADPEPILQAGTAIESGFVRCADGFVHRAFSATCVSPALAGGCGPSGNSGRCASDAACIERSYGACVDTPFGGCGCTYGCATDADCDAGEGCACAGVVVGRARCIPAACSASSECGDGLCGLSIDVDSCGRYYGRLACHGAAQECRVDANCGPEEAVWCDYASYQPQHQCRLVDLAWSCTDIGDCGPCG